MNTITEAVLAYAPHHDWAGPGPWFLVFPLFWVAVIVTAIVLFKRRGDRMRREGGAEGVLRERYARGEVSEDEFRERLTVLRRK